MVGYARQSGVVGCARQSRAVAWWSGVAGRVEQRLGGVEWRLGGVGEAAELCGAAELLGVPLTCSSRASPNVNLKQF